MKKSASERRRIHAFLSRLDRPGLRRALWLLRRQDARPNETNPAAAQYDDLATPATVRAEDGTIYDRERGYG